MWPALVVVTRDSLSSLAPASCGRRVGRYSAGAQRGTDLVEVVLPALADIVHSGTDVFLAVD